MVPTVVQCYILTFCEVVNLTPDINNYRSTLRSSTSTWRNIRQNGGGTEPVWGIIAEPVKYGQ